MSDEDQLKRMVMTFRVSELQMLLGFAGKNKTGRKNELQNRALDIVKFRSPNIHQKIRDLYKSIQLEMMTFGDRSQAAAAVSQTTNIMSTTRVPAAINSVPGGYQQTGVGSTYGSMGHTSVYGSRSSSSQSHTSLANSSYSNQNSHGSYPINPDVRLKMLPFFDILAELLKPCTLAPHGSGRYQEASFSFSLTPQQANKIAHSRDLRPGKQDYLVQVQVRFCLLETTCEQEDNFPPSITLKVNDKLCPLPSPIPTNKAGVEPKRPSRPVNVTGFCKISPTVSNRILVTWASDYGRCYAISGYLVQKLTSEDLLSRLKGKRARLADFTRSLIKQKLREDSECEIASTSLRCSLMCPLGKMRMVLPCRAETCIHLQCFDASLYLQMNERKPTWTCPVCDKPAIYDNLVIDGYFQEVLQSNSICSEVTLNQDGSWTPTVAKKEPKEQVMEKKKSEVAVETLSDDSDDDDPKDDSVIEEVKSKRKIADVEIITLTDSEDESPPQKKLATSNSDADGSSKGHSGTVNSNPSIEASTNNSETVKANDSWHVGEVDHGKRLVFRKATSSSTNGTSTTSNSGFTAASPVSSRSGSPQVICLDSPVYMSSPSPPSNAGQNVPSNIATTASSQLTNTAPPMAEPPPYTSSSAEYPYDRTTLTGSSGAPVSYIPVSSHSPGIVPSSTSPYLMTDPLFASSFLPSTIGDPFVSPFLPPPANLASGLPDPFNPMGLNVPGQSNTNQNSFRSPDHY